MKMALTAAVLSAIIAVTAYAGDTVAFSFKTIDGKTVEFMPGSTAMVVNVGSHW